MSRIITISREFGSGGRELGKRLSEQLGFSYYDREIITRLAEETDLDESVVDLASEKGIRPIPYRKGISFQAYPMYQKQQIDILVAEREVIKKIAKEGDCVIVGRCGYEVLKGDNAFHLFVYSDMPSKIKRCREREKNSQALLDREIEKKIKDVENKRKRYHELVTKNSWKDVQNFHLCINTTDAKIKDIIKPLSDYILDDMDWRMGDED